MFCNLKSDWQLFPGRFVFSRSYLRKGTGFERKNKVNFLKTFLIILFQNIVFKRTFLHAIAVLGYLPKFKKGLGPSFGTHFMHDFSIKVFVI